MKQQLCQVIKPDEKLDYNNINLIVDPNINNNSLLIVYPFTNCFPFDRRTNIEKWNEIACKIFHYVTKVEVKLNIEEAEKYKYGVEYYGDNGRFRIQALASGTYFHQKAAIEAIKIVMKDIIGAINEIIETAWLHKKMLECFPEFNSEKTINTEIDNIKIDIRNIRRGC